jgi:hypothetical protein
MDRSKNVALMIPGLALAALVYVGLNEARYHTIFDIGLNLIPNTGDGPRWGFQFAPFNLKTMLWLMPRFDATFPYFHPIFLGQGLLITSPAFLLALRGRRWEMAICALLVATPMLFVWANGFAQFGCRHFLPMFPFLLVMMAERPLGWFGKALIAVSIFIVGVSMWQIHEVGLTVPW